jgi:hypothetical protein
VLTSVQAQQAVTPRFVPAPSGAALALAEAPAKVVAQPSVPRGPASPDDVEPYVRIDLPGPQRLFQRDSEAQFFERIVQEMRKQKGRAIFPVEPVISREPFQPRNFPPMVELVEPGYVCHGRLLFEQPNFERIGYDFGILQPAICLGVFYYDTALLPYHVFSDLASLGECNVGKCLPGDQAPLLLPIERFSVTGLVGQSGAVIGGIFLFP